MNIIDSHIHLDLYDRGELQEIINNPNFSHLKGLISVSMNLSSSKVNLALAKENPLVYPAFGFHPEQALPTKIELENLLNWIKLHNNAMVAIGEVGLPYYLRKEQKMDNTTYQEYINLLEQFIMLASELNKPIVLHAVHDDAPIVCNLLEKYNVTAAHFHWFKGELDTINRMIRNGYYISITPDVLYKKNTMEIVKQYPLKQIMVETDGPWPFEGPFHGKMTHPVMIHESVKKIAELKQISTSDVYNTIFDNTVRFFHLDN